MNSQEEKRRKINNQLPEDLESPFLEGEFFSREVDEEWEARLVALEAESPFARGLEQEAYFPVEPVSEKEDTEEEEALFEEASYIDEELEEYGASEIEDFEWEEEKTPDEFEEFHEEEEFADEEFNEEEDEEIIDKAKFSEFNSNEEENGEGVEEELEVDLEAEFEEDFEEFESRNRTQLVSSPCFSRNKLTQNPADGGTDEVNFLEFDAGEFTENHEPYKVQGNIFFPIRIARKSNSLAPVVFIAHGNHATYHNHFDRKIETCGEEISFKITELSLENLKSEGLPDDVINKLKTIKNQEFIDKQKFLEKLRSTIGVNQTVGYESSILEHAINKDFVPTPNHWGYSYLQIKLAQHGIISVSVNCNKTNCQGLSADNIRLRAKLILECILALFNPGTGLTITPQVGQNIDFSKLRQNMDFTRIGFLGHSRGGEAVLVAAEEIRKGSITIGGQNISLKDLTVRGIISLAPTDQPASSGRPVGFAYMVILPAEDGDVFDNNGARFYDQAVPTPFKTQLYIRKTNHNYFNNEWVNDDRESFLEAPLTMINVLIARVNAQIAQATASGTTPSASLLNEKNFLNAAKNKYAAIKSSAIASLKQQSQYLHSKAVHQNILNAYGVAFFRQVLLNHNMMDVLTDRASPPGVPMGDIQISSELSKATTVDNNEQPDIHVNTLGRSNTLSGGISASEKPFRRSSTSYNSFYGNTTGMVAQNAPNIRNGLFRSELPLPVDLSSGEIWLRAAEVYKPPFSRMPRIGTGFELGLEDVNGVRIFVDSNKVAGKLVRPVRRLADMVIRKMLIYVNNELKSFGNHFSEDDILLFDRHKTIPKTMRFPAACFTRSTRPFNIRQVRAILIRLNRKNTRPIAFDQLQIVNP